MATDLHYKYSHAAGSLVLQSHLTFVPLSLAFLTEVDSSSHPVIMELIGKHVVGTKEAARIIKQPILQQEPNSIQVIFLEKD